MTIDDPQAQPPEAFFTPAAPVPQRHHFEFTGSGSEYFRIWIVNLLLCIVTLGIYSAWAKVRSQQYFHRNTLLAGSSFDYHALPGTILKGQAVAVLLFVAYSVSTQFLGGTGTALTLAVAGAIVPWLLWRSLKFRLSVLSYRGLRFSFHGPLKGSYKVFLLWPVLTVFTLYLLTPFTHRAIKAYQHGNSRYGKTAFSFDGTTRSFYAVYATCVIPLFLLIAVPLAAAGFAVLSGPEGKANLTRYGVYGLFWVYLLLFAAGPILVVRLRNLIWNHTRLGEHRIISSASVWRYVLIQLSNYLLILLTLGLYIPFARVRRVRYLASATSIVMAGNMDEFVAEQASAGVGAAGAETADLFGIDIAL